MDYLYAILYFILKGMANIWFWLFIVCLAALGRYLVTTGEIDYAGKSELNLSPGENKRRKRLIFWGRASLTISFSFMILFVIFCFIL